MNMFQVIEITIFSFVAWHTPSTWDQINVTYFFSIPVLCWIFFRELMMWLMMLVEWLARTWTFAHLDIRSGSARVQAQRDTDSHQTLHWWWLWWWLWWPYVDDQQTQLSAPAPGWSHWCCSGSCSPRWWWSSWWWWWWCSTLVTGCWWWWEWSWPCLREDWLHCTVLLPPAPDPEDWVSLLSPVHYPAPPPPLPAGLSAVISAAPALCDPVQPGHSPHQWLEPAPPHWHKPHSGHPHHHPPH